MTLTPRPVIEAEKIARDLIRHITDGKTSVPVTAGTIAGLLAGIDELCAMRAAAADSDESSLWLSAAHALADESGIPPGHIITRIAKMRAAVPTRIESGPVQEPIGVFTGRFSLPFFEVRAVDALPTPGAMLYVVREGGAA